MIPDDIQLLIEQELCAGEHKDPKAFPRCPHCGMEWHGLAHGSQCPGSHEAHSAVLAAEADFIDYRRLTLARRFYRRLCLWYVGKQ